MAIDKKDLEQVYQDLETTLYNFSLRWVFDENLAQELMHEAFIKVWQKRHSVKLETIKSLLFKTIQNLAINHLRRQKLMKAFDFSEILNLSGLDFQSSEDQLVVNENMRQLKSALDQIPLKQKEVLLLSYIGEFSDKEIASTLGISEGTVASRKSRALKKAKVQWKGGPLHV